jgi:hypothetical protein
MERTIPGEIYAVLNLPVFNALTLAADEAGISEDTDIIFDGTREIFRGIAIFVLPFSL